MWGTFYDIRRYGGLQIFLRAVVGGGSLVLSSAGEPVGGSPGAARRPRRDPSLRHAVPLVARAHGSGGADDRAALCPPVRRNRRPDHARQSARGLSAGRSSATPMRRPRRASASRWMTASKAFPAHFVDAGKRDVDIKVDGRLAAAALGANGDPLYRNRRPRARGRRRIRRHRRHRGTARRALLLRRPQGRHHQCRRTEGASRGSRGRHQPACRRVGVRW